MVPTPRFRFAPSPNGDLHLGHAFSALFSQQQAEAAGGEFLLRIEDIDFIRCRPIYADHAMEDLQWLGLTWAEPVRRQSRYLPAYRAALDRLHNMGLVYRCFASRQEIRDAIANRPEWPLDPDGVPVYPGLHKSLSERERQRHLRDAVPAALRLDMDRALFLAGPSLTFIEDGYGPGGETGLVEAHPARWGDVVLGRRDIGVSYHIAVTIDDAVQGITHVTRGQDLFHATGVHRLLQRLLNLPEPRYHHHQLIGDEAGRKLSKSAGDRSLRSLRAAGVTSAEIRDSLGFSCKSRR